MRDVSNKESVVMLSNVFSRSRKRVAALALTLLLGIAAPAFALGIVYPPPPLGYPLLQSYGTQAANWWKWLLKTSADKSPLRDTTGANCAQGQSTTPGAIWFLAGAPSNDPVQRSCTIPSGRTLFFPVVNKVWLGFESDPPEQKTDSFIRAQVANVANATNLEVEIDGIAVANVDKYLEKSDIFKATLPANNLYDLPAGFVTNPDVDSGFYIAVNPLSPGKHTIHFHAELLDPDLGPIVQDVTYDLTIKILPF
jgi:hypothetical protein